MIDIHSHILPNIDDGSNDPIRSLEHLKGMEEGGITRVYLTSHYFRGHYQYERDEYDAKLNALRDSAREDGLSLDLQSGFEVFIQPGIVQDIQNKCLCLGESSFVLIESELNGLPSDFYSNVYPLLRAGYKPILAHAERYVSIMKKPTKAQDLIDRNIYIQTNAGSILGHYGEKVRQTAWVLLENGWSHFLASDDHVKGDYGTLMEAYQMVASRIDEHTADLLCKEFPAAIANGDKIPYSYVYVQRPKVKRHRSLMERMFG
ncbi:MAG: capsular biosynthesis protein [Candidatus Cloacimonetes bacterium]|jgi:protein-tyrosine phosphatase|nr:capsular biosynthesis protein [Candidatus Cloacimonadota bacterium]MDD2506018.1 capsular biosynthesis protein [Candidatus Cloacimonadota bacterium]MDD4560512.1 capsular biosynthesis protein [Candidatus Cloacimonadota bacterium]